MRVNRVGTVRWSSDALAALYPGTRSAAKRAELAARQAAAMTEELRHDLVLRYADGVVKGVVSVTEPSDAEETRDVAAEEREALAEQAKRDADLVRRQRERE